MNLRYTLVEGATAPKRVYEGDAGLDLHALEDVQVSAMRRRTVRTGLSVEIPLGYVGLVLPRSGLARSTGVIANTGVIDAGYRGEILVMLINSSHDSYGVNAGDRIAQLLICPIATPELELVEQLTPSARGASGFGSSGR